MKFFLDFKVKMAYFRGLCAKFRFFYDHDSIEIQQYYKDCHGDRLACDKKRYSRASILLSSWSNPLKLTVRCRGRRRGGEC